MVFNVLPNPINPSYEITGKWKMNFDARRLEGSWRAKGSPEDTGGDWNLTKVGTDQEEVDAGYTQLIAWSVPQHALTHLWIADIDEIEVQQFDKDYQESKLEGSESGTDCQPDQATLEVIESARSDWNRSEYVPDAYGLIQEALSSAESPRCDNVRARILATKAKDLILLAELESVADKQSEPVKSSETQIDYDQKRKKVMDNCGKVAEPVAKTIYLSSFTPVTTTGCVILSASTATTEGFGGLDVAAFRKSQQIHFVTVNRDSLSKQTARGSGEFIAALAYLQGCPDETYEKYTRVTQQSFDRIFPEPESDTSVILSRLAIEINNDSHLSETCKWV